MFVVVGLLPQIGALGVHAGRRIAATGVPLAT
jgi:hypothetical protein